MHKIEMYLKYSSPWYTRKMRRWDMVFKSFGYDYQVQGDRFGVLVYSDEPSSYDVSEMVRAIYSNF